MNDKKFRFFCIILLCFTIFAACVMAAEPGIISSLRAVMRPDTPVIDESAPKSKHENTGETPAIMERFAGLYSQNPDFVGWLRIPNTNIDYPVAHCDDNDFYLKHDFNKEPSKNGTPFLDKGADLLANNQSLSIYGHYINGIMFTDLHKYKKLDFYKKTPVFKFDSLYENGEYKVFSVFYMAGNKSDALFYYYPVSRFESDDDFMEHVRQLKIRSIFTIPVDVGPEDQLVLLTCCSYETNDLRFVVAGRKVRPDEDPYVDTSSATLNPEPLYPQKWYDKKGGFPPSYSSGSIGS